METQQIVVTALGIVFGLAFPPHQYIRFLICIACYVGAMASMVFL